MKQTGKTVAYFVLPNNFLNTYIFIIFVTLKITSFALRWKNKSKKYCNTEQYMLIIKTITIKISKGGNNKRVYI